MEFTVNLNGRDIKIQIGRTLSSTADSLTKQVYIDGTTFHIEKRNGMCRKVFGGSNPLNSILMQQICKHIK